MASQMTTIVRFVKCPRCRQILPERADVPVYKCAECGVVLRAKYWKVKDTGSPCIHEADPSQKFEEQVHQDKEASRLNQKDTIIHSTNESDSEKICERDQSPADSQRECLGGLNQSNEEVPCPASPSCHENADSLLEARAHTEAGEDKTTSANYSSVDYSISGDYDKEQPGDRNVLTEVFSSTELNHYENEPSLPGSGSYENQSLMLSPQDVDESRYPLENNNGGGQRESVICDQQLLNSSKMASSSFECSSQEIEEPSQIGRTTAEADGNLNSHSECSSLGGENIMDIMPNDQIGTAQSSSSGSVSSDSLMSPSTELMKQAHNGMLPGFQRVSSDDTLENIPLVYDRSKLGVTLRSPTAINYYANNGSTSSCNETDDQVSSRHFHTSKRNSDSTRVLPKRDGFTVSQAMSGESRLQYKPMNPSSNLSGKKHHATKGSKWHQDESPEPTRHSHPFRSTMRMDTDEQLSGMPFYSKGSGTGHRNEHQTSTSYHLSANHLETDKMELLRMVYELQDQLKRTQILEGMPNGRFSTRDAKTEDTVSSNYDHLAQERQAFTDPKHPRYRGKYGQGNTWFQKGKVPRMAFLGDAAHYRQQVDCSCSRCCPQERHFSAQLPQYAVCCNIGHHVTHHIHDYYSPYHSATSSPHSREKRHPVKQHFRPIAGGAPIIACYRCFELLQLPADFLLFKRKCHRLRCSVCSEELKFSLQYKRHIVQYSLDPTTTAPLPSEADDYADMIKKRNLASASGASAEPVSCSDDYGQSFSRTYSTDEVDPPLDTLNRFSDGTKKSSGSSFEATEEQGKKSGNINKNHVDPPWPTSSKLGNSSSEIEEVPPANGSPLHRLMGYTSPSRLIYR